MSRPPAPPPRSRPQVELRNNLPTCRQSSRKASEVCGWSLALIEEFNPSPRGDGDVSAGRRDGRLCRTDGGEEAPGTGSRDPHAGSAPGLGARDGAGSSGGAAVPLLPAGPGQVGGRAARRSTDRDTGRWQRGRVLASAERRSQSAQPGLSLRDPGFLRRPAPSQLLAAPAPLCSPGGPCPAGEAAPGTALSADTRGQRPRLGRSSPARGRSRRYRPGCGRAGPRPVLQSSGSRCP